MTGESARGVITGYKVSLEKVDEDNLEEAQPLSRTTGTTSFVFNSLSKYSNYSVQVEAYTSVGSGPLSPPIYCQTEEDGEFLLALNSMSQSKIVGSHPFHLDL